MLAVAFRLSNVIVMYLDFTEIKQRLKEDLEKEENTDKCQCKECFWKNYVIVILIGLIVPLFCFLLSHIEIVVKAK